jgi:tRNA-dihydrouridine synthase A
LFGGAGRCVEQAVDGYLEYVARQLAQGVALHAMTRHMLGLFNGRRGARLFRRHLSENATRPGADIDVLRDALAFVAQPEPCDA